MTIRQEFINEIVEFLKRYYSEEIGELAKNFPRDQKSLYIAYDDVYTFDPEVGIDLRKQPEQVLECFNRALGDYPLPVDLHLQAANVRIYGLPEPLDVEEASREENIGSLIDICGQVQKVSAVKPRIKNAVFICDRCGTQNELPQSGEQLEEPHECQGCEREGPYSLNEQKSEWTNHQYVRLQQPPERTNCGRGDTVDVHLKEDLIQQCEAGDRITLTGILDVENPDRNQSLAFDTTVDAQAVVREESDYEDIDIEAYYDEITAIASGEKGDPYELLIDSINPEHQGDEDIKLAIALQMFGGWSRGGRKRGDSHILLLGDPGCGKSTFLQSVDTLAPRSTYASGKGATAAGITAAAVSDDFGDSEWGLEAGALVLADGGIACLDEIDKVSDTAVSSMHDALESQKVRVNKAGINATLNSRTALLAAGNPSEGRFDPYQPRAQQINLDPTLMSRFDLTFMLSDTPDVEEDQEVIDHMIRSRRAAAKQELDEELTEDELRSVEPAIPKEVLRAYIAYAKKEVTPYLPQENSEAREHLEEEFLKLRLANKDEDSNAIPVTFRQEEAIERLAEASARVRLDDRVNQNDIDRALDLVKKSMQQVGIDPETGVFDADVVETGQSKSQQQRRKQVTAIIEEKDGATFEEIVNITGEAESRIQNDIQSLKDRGKIYELEDEIRRT